MWWIRSNRKGMYENPIIQLWALLVILALAWGLGNKLGEWVFSG